MNVMASDRIAYSTDPTIAKTKSIKFQHFKMARSKSFLKTLLIVSTTTTMMMTMT